MSKRRDLKFTFELIPEKGYNLLHEDVVEFLAKIYREVISQEDQCDK